MGKRTPDFSCFTFKSWENKVLWLSSSLGHMPTPRPHKGTEMTDLAGEAPLTPLKQVTGGGGGGKAPWGSTETSQRETGENSPHPSAVEGAQTLGCQE